MSKVATFEQLLSDENITLIEENSIIILLKTATPKLYSLRDFLF